MAAQRLDHGQRTVRTRKRRSRQGAQDQEAEGATQGEGADQGEYGDVAAVAAAEQGGQGPAPEPEAAAAPAQAESKSKVTIVYEEIERLKLFDTALETLLLIVAIGILVFQITPMLLQKLGVGCGGSFCPNDMIGFDKNVRCDEASVFITGLRNCSALWTKQLATQCQQSGPYQWGCCIRIDEFFPCESLPTCDMNICDVKAIAFRSFMAMYLFNVVEDVWDLVDVLLSLLTFGQAVLCAQSAQRLPAAPET